MVAGPLVFMLVHSRSDSAVSHEQVRPDLNSRYTEANLGRQRKFVVSCATERRDRRGAPPRRPPSASIDSGRCHDASVRSCSTRAPRSAARPLAMASLNCSGGQRDAAPLGCDGVGRRQVGYTKPSARRTCRHSRAR